MCQDALWRLQSQALFQIEMGREIGLSGFSRALSTGDRERVMCEICDFPKALQQY